MLEFGAVLALHKVEAFLYKPVGIPNLLLFSPGIAVVRSEC